MPQSKSRPVSKTNRPHPPTPLDLFDETVSACQAIEVLAQLLGMAGASGYLDAGLAAETGWMIRSKAEELRQTLKSLEKGVVR